VQGLIAARLDGLSAEEKRIVQDASVFGKIFWAGALDADEHSLHSLERKGMLRRERRSAVGGETQYAFRHVLVRDVAYGQIPRAKRAEKHVRAAGWIEALGRTDDHAELVAYHLAEAFELGLDTGDRLVEALSAAARRAIALNAYAGALDYSRRALALPIADDARRAHLLAVHARALTIVHADTSALRGAIDELESIGDVEAAADLAAFAANAEWTANRRPEAEELVARGEALLADREPTRALCAVLSEKARLSGFVDAPDVAEATAREALALAERFELLDRRAECIANLANIAWTRGEYERSAELNDEALAVAPPASRQALRAMANRSLAELAAADGASLRASLARSLEAAQRLGDAQFVVWMMAPVIWENYFSLGRWDEALEKLAAVIRDVERTGGSYMQSNFYVERAMILASRGRDAEAHADLDLAVAFLETNRDIQFQASLLTAAVPVYDILGDRAGAAALLDRLLGIGRPTTTFAPPLLADTVIAIARHGYGGRFLERFAGALPHRRFEAACLVWTGRAVEAADIYAGASPQEEAAARLFAAEQLRAAGRTAESAVQLERGLAFFRAVGARRIIEMAEEPLRAAAAAE
jgi:tetratricopeptide (TPR) repeat protein